MDLVTNMGRCVFSQNMVNLAVLKYESISLMKPLKKNLFFAQKFQNEPCEVPFSVNTALLQVFL